MRGLVVVLFLLDIVRRRWRARRMRRWQDAQIDRLIADLSASFAGASVPALDRAIDSALERIARVLDVHRTGIVDCESANGDLVFTRRWCDEGVTPLPISLRSDELPVVSERLRRGQIVRFNQRSEVPSARARVDRATLARLGETALLLLPLTINGEVRGGWWVSGPQQRWSNAMIWRLDGVAATLSLALRLRAEIEARTRAEVEVEQRRRDSAHGARVAAIGGLTASLAHELNQPLTAIRSNAQTAQHYLAAPLPRRVDELQNILVDIVADVTRAGDIIDRMRGLMKNGPASAGVVDLNEVIRAVTKLLASDALIRRATVASLLEPALPSIRGDRVQLQQVVLNLLLNALEAMDRGRGSERRVTVSTRVRDPARVVVTVRDTGPGLGPVPERWFKPFHSTKEDGLGVGLSISRMIVEAHGGSITAENNESGGASFHVHLPTNEGASS